ncbi:hypothetical protein PENARI_c015G00751 [Penicillium arizonense]|uniref:N-acetyltransferase domain-containing protein n=1 Tax=Penicillium arizonense TaxID=1835702 RepID=A0A1F5LD63_PENAI|nr:hypothetical protein PENARI_c015G00751 [Penicillium arizonense]OGE50869.1 hypothetical protein PENARI_c015G00751 [Penicillium arizonense]
MSLEMIPATPADGAELTEIFYAAFVGDFNRTMFPHTPDVTAWWEQNFHDTIKRSIATETNEVILKVVDSDQGAIVAFAKWKCPTSADRDRHEHLDMLAVHPSHQGRGLASKLLKWGLARADEEGVEVYLSSSPEGKPVYEKYGFRALESFSPFPEYVQY